MIHRADITMTLAARTSQRIYPVYGCLLYGWLIMISLWAGVACKSFAPGEAEPTPSARLQYVHDKTHVLYFARDPHSSYYRFVMCLINPATSADTPQLLEQSCVNSFQLQDGSGALFTLTALQAVKPDGQWEQDDIDALNRLKAHHQALIQSTPAPDHDTASSTQNHSPLHLMRTGYALIGLDFIKEILVNPILVKTKPQWISSIKLMRHVGWILLASGTGVYFAQPTENSTESSCADKSSSDDDPLAAHFTDACGQPVQNSFKDAADTLAAKYVQVPALQLHWQDLMSTTKWQDTPAVSDLATGLARHINHTVFHGGEKAIVSICFPALSDSSPESSPKTVQDLINDRKALAAGKQDLKSVQSQCTDLT